jgi:hypothetical protein
LAIGLCRRFRKLVTEHQPAPKVAMAIARELAGCPATARHAGRVSSRERWTVNQRKDA